MVPIFTPPLRIGICGFFLESNRWSPVTTQAMFAASLDISGDTLYQELSSAQPRTLPDTSGFVATMNRLGNWTPVALRLAAAQPGGPADHCYFEAFVEDITHRIRAAGPLDAIFISSHGAALTTQEDDPDGRLFACIRSLVGPRVPIIAVLDLHTNVSARMTDALSAFVAYRTNPHVDLWECGAEAAEHVHRLLRDGPGVVEMVKLPLAPPATSQLVSPGSVYSELIALGQTYVHGNVLNVSLCGGFALADCVKCGFSVVVSCARNDRTTARRVTRALAQSIWSARQRFVSQLTPLEDAVAAAVATGHSSGPRLILADVADNPGGGGGGNTVTLLQALLAAGANGVLMGVQTDAALAQEAHDVGVGATFDAHFNRQNGGDRFAQTFSAQARVLALSDGHFVGRQGMLKGSVREMGASALLEIDGVQLAVISLRQQLLDSAQLDVLGVDLNQVRTLVVKSRGHFRATFQGFAPPERILEVDCPGLTTPNLKTLPWTKIPRPIFPIDEDATWP